MYSVSVTTVDYLVQEVKIITYGFMQKGHYTQYNSLTSGKENVTFKI